MTLYAKSDDNLFYILFSISSKIEIFKKQNGFILCEGLYFNETWDYNKQDDFKVIEETPMKIKISDKFIVIFDASITGSLLKDNLTEEKVDVIENDDTFSYSIIKLENGLYNVKKVELQINLYNQHILLKGVEISN